MHPIPSAIQCPGLVKVLAANPRLAGNEVHRDLVPGFDRLPEYPPSETAGKLRTMYFSLKNRYSTPLSIVQLIGSKYLEFPCDFSK